MIEPQFIHYSPSGESFGLKIALRCDYYDLFRKILKQFFDESGCNLFHHNIIKNYRKKGHRISTFGSHEKWHNLYWHQYCWDDPLEQKVHKTVLENDISILSMNILESDNLCSEARLRVCDVKNGFAVSLNYADDIKETMVFGWKNLETYKVTPEKIMGICHVLNPIREFHRERGLEIFS